MNLPAALTGLVGDRYRIERELGRGGMATVFLAEDLRHRRRVAFKVLRPELAAAVGADRFLREIETTAGLQHPHILPLFDSGVIEGSLFYVMPYVEGGTLRERLDREGTLPLAGAIRIAHEVADALDHAHAHGVLHRDIKPENILLSGGHALVADFGIARVTGVGGARLTEAGVALGTPAYMSPEQAFGEDPGPGSDQYSLACVVCEMVTGRVPFEGPSAQAILARRLTEDPPSLAAAGAGVPAEVDRAIARALARDPADRFATVTAFAEAMTPLGAAIPSGPDDQTVAVLDFTNRSGNAEHDWLSTGIAETVAVDLQRVAGIRVVPRGPGSGPARQDQSPADLGRALGARWLVTGGFQVLGSRIRITPQLHDVATDTAIGASKLDGSLDEVFALQDRIVAEVLEALQIAPTAAEAEEIARPETSELQAYQCYASGRQCFNRFGEKAFAEAAGHFQRAIEIDSDYALAHAGLGSIHVFRYIATTDPGDLAIGVERLSRAVELDPGRAEPHQWLAYAYTRAGRLDEAETAALRATALEPGNAMAHYFLAVARCVLGEQRRDWSRFVGAAESYRRSIEAEPAYLMAYAGLAWLYLQSGQYDEARRVIEGATPLEWSGRTRGPAILGGVSYFRARLALREGRDEAAERDLVDLARKLEQTEHVYTQLYLGMTAVSLAEVALRRRAWDRAVAHALRARELADRHRYRLAMGHLVVLAETALAKAMLGLGDQREAERHFEEARTVHERPGEWDLSWGFEITEAARLVELAGYLASAGREGEAMVALGEAVDRGWGDLAGLEHDPAFNRVRGLEAMAVLRARMEERGGLA